MLDAALLAAAPAGRFATRFDDIADGVSALGRAANSEFTDRLLRLHFDEIGSIGRRTGNVYIPTGPMVGRKIGHTFTKHGSHNTHQLTMQATRSRKPQGQWLDDRAAETIIADALDLLANGTIDIPIPPGVGRVINPDGTFSLATHARLVPSKTGVKTAFPFNP